MNWLDVYDTQYRPLLDSKSSGAKRGLQEGLYHRADGFRLMFSNLLSRKTLDFHIIETGTLRNPGNWKDGQSARLFTEFVDMHGGSVRSVDIDPEAVATARSAIVSQRFSVTESDSVAWLNQQKDLRQVDLFYLDSWDVKWRDDRASAEHHLLEFQAIEPYLRPGTLVAIDDNARFLDSGGRTGKGRRIVEYLQGYGKHPIYDAYQIIYQF